MTAPAVPSPPGVPAPDLPVSATASPPSGPLSLPRRIARAVLIVLTGLAIYGIAVGLAFWVTLAGAFAADPLELVMNAGGERRVVGGNALIASLVLSGTLGLLSVLFASFTREGLARRLLLVRPSGAPRVVWLLLPATLTVIATGIPLLFLCQKLVPADPEFFALFTLRYESAPWAWRLGVIGVTALAPALGEELLFRGYLQEGLLRPLGPKASVAIATVAFCAAHHSLHHAVMILPVALWLGVLALRTRSLVPGILCHALMNLVGNVAMNLGWNLIFVYTGAAVIGFPAFLASIRGLETPRVSGVAPRQVPGAST